MLKKEGNSADVKTLKSLPGVSPVCSAKGIVDIDIR